MDRQQARAAGGEVRGGVSVVDDALRERDDTAFAIAMSNLVFSRREAAGFEALSEAEQTVYCLDALEREVNNGGFSQFFFNSSGDTALETVSALERLGARHTAGLVRRAVSVFPDGPSPQRDAREKQMDGLPESARELWSKLDEEFFEYRDNLAALERAYVAARRAEFK
jgi:hypothetical protein